MSSPRERLARGIGWTLCVAIVLFLLACLGLALPGDLALAVGFGWIWFLARVGPQITVSWDGVATAVIAACLCLGLGHVLLQRLSSGASGASSQGPWPFSRTVLLFAIILLVFVAGLAAVGVAHQAVWVVRSGEPVLYDGSEVAVRIQSSNNLKQLALGTLFHEEEKRLRHPPRASTPQGGACMVG